LKKKKRVIELHLKGKTIRDISKEVHMSFGPISKIIKAYDKKIRLQSNQKEINPNSQIKKPSISSLLLSNLGMVKNSRMLQLIYRFQLEKL